MKPHFRQFICCLFFLIFSIYAHAATSTPKGYVLEVTGPIGPATQDYVIRGLEIAVKDQAQFVILQIDTPGGLESSMRGINAALLKSSIPIIAYVAPSGARAASAGTYLLYASHIAAMAPGTHLGAATPINIGGTENHQNTAITKATNDSAAYLRSLAKMRGRNVVFADEAVKSSTSITADEALNKKVIEIIAKDYPELLQKIHGRTVNAGDKKIVLASNNTTLTTVAKDWRHDFLSFLTNPNIAYLLMLAAIYGLFFEISNPGMILPGVIGIIALLLVLYSFQLMPINYVGLTLVLIGIVFILLEISITSYGVLGLGGVIAFIIGSIMLFDHPDPNYRISKSLIFSMSIITLAFFFLILTIAIRSQKRAVTTGREGLIGSTGTVISVENQQVLVRVLGEIWEARYDHPIERGDEVIVTGVKDLTLSIEKKRS